MWELPKNKNKIDICVLSKVLYLDVLIKKDISDITKQVICTYTYTTQLPATQYIGSQYTVLLRGPFSKGTK